MSSTETTQKQPPPPQELSGRKATTTTTTPSNPSIASSRHFPLSNGVFSQKTKQYSLVGLSQRRFYNGPLAHQPAPQTRLRILCARGAAANDAHPTASSRGSLSQTPGPNSSAICLQARHQITRPTASSRGISSQPAAKTQARNCLHARTPQHQLTLVPQQSSRGNPAAQTQGCKLSERATQRRSDKRRLSYSKLTGHSLANPRPNFKRIITVCTRKTPHLQTTHLLQ